MERVGPFDASSYNYHRWNIVVIIFVLWSAVSVFVVFFLRVFSQLSIPIRVGFDDLWSEKYHWAHVMFLFVDYVGDVCFIVDIFVNFRTSYMDHGIVHRETRKMAMYYLKGNFKWDLLASIDLGLIRWSIALHALLRVNRLIRMKKVLVSGHSFGAFSMSLRSTSPCGSSTPSTPTGFPSSSLSQELLSTCTGARLGPL